MPLIIHELSVEIPVEPNQVAGDSESPAGSGGEANMQRTQEALALAEERRERLNID